MAIVDGSSELRAKLESGESLEAIEEEAMVDVIENVDVITAAYLVDKKNQENELNTLKEQASQVEVEICKNNNTIKENMSKILELHLQTRLLQLNAANGLLESISTTYTSLPKTTLQTDEFKEFSRSWDAAKIACAECINETSLEEIVYELVNIYASGCEVVDTLLGHHCSVISNFVEDLLLINSLEQKNIEKLLEFDATGSATLFFSDVNTGLIEMGGVLGSSMRWLSDARDTVLSLETEFHDCMDASEKLVAKIYIPINCMLGKIETLLQFEVHKLEPSGALYTALTNGQHAVVAMQEFTNNMVGLVNVSLRSCHAIASVSKNVLGDFFTGSNIIITNLTYKSQVVANYYGANNSCLIKLLGPDSSISTKLKAFIGNTTVLASFGVFAFSAPGVAEKYPVLSTSTCEQLMVASEDSPILFTLGNELLAEFIADYAKKTLRIRDYLILNAELVLSRVKEVGDILDTIVNDGLPLVHQCISNKEIVMLNLEKIAYVGLTATLDMASLNQNCTN